MDVRRNCNERRELPLQNLRAGNSVERIDAGTLTPHNGGTLESIGEFVNW